MTHVEFPLSAKTQGLISEFLRVEKLEEQLTNEKATLGNDLMGLQKAEVDKMLDQKSAPQGGKQPNTIKATREKALDLDGKIGVCQAKKIEIHAAILASMKTDRAEWLHDLLPREKARMLEEKAEAYRAFLTAMAFAAVQQIVYGGQGEAMVRANGPTFIGFLIGEDRHFYNLEIDRIMKEKGLPHMYDSARARTDRLQLLEIRAKQQEQEGLEPDIDGALERARREALPVETIKEDADNATAAEPGNGAAEIGSGKVDQAEAGREE